MITFQEESWKDFYPDGEKLFPLHWEELALNKDKIKQSVDHERYAQLDSMGMIYTITARKDGNLVGYAICFLITHMHYKDSGMMALADMYYILPEFRKGGCGARLFVEMENGLRKKGVVRAHMSCKVHQDHEALFARLGWEFTDKTFSKYIKEEACQ